MTELTETGITVAIGQLAAQAGVPDYMMQSAVNEMALSMGLGDSLDDQCVALAATAGYLRGRGVNVGDWDGDWDAFSTESLQAARHQRELLELASDVSDADRAGYARKGWALKDGSYPIPDVEHLHAAAHLCKTHHGDWQAAAKLIAKRASELGVANPLDDDDSGSAAASVWHDPAGFDVSLGGTASDPVGLASAPVELAPGLTPAMFPPGMAPASSADLEVQEIAGRHMHLGVFDGLKLMRPSMSSLAAQPPVPATSGTDEYLMFLSRTGAHPQDEVLRLTADPRSARWFRAANDDGMDDEPNTDPDVADEVQAIVARSRGVLSNQPRKKRRGNGKFARQSEVTTSTRAHASDLDEDHTDHAQPSRGGQAHAEVARIIHQHEGLGVFGTETPQSGSKVIQPRSAAQRQRDETRALGGGRPQNPLTDDGFR